MPIPKSSLPCPSCPPGSATSQRVYLGHDTRFESIDPKEATARRQFAAALVSSQQSGHSHPTAGTKPWSARHAAIATKLPVRTAMVRSVSGEGKRVASAGGKLVAHVK